MDDILITGSDTKYITQLITTLNTRFVMKELGDLSYFLGIEVLKTDSGVLLSQTKYAMDLLCKAGMQECKSSSTSSSVKPPIPGIDFEFSDYTWYRTIVGSLQL